MASPGSVNALTHRFRAGTTPGARLSHCRSTVHPCRARSQSIADAHIDSGTDAYP